ncbi:PRTRC system protein A [Sphingomonas sp. 1185]|uniref:PRTRC system protein A n=1 Tax=Sphingomonas sp. 1185 TaxID=3156411 RepID=UPI003390DF49
MTQLADDPTAVSILAAVPCYPVPAIGRSPAIDTLRATRVGHGFVIGNDGVMLILRRPWLILDLPVTPPIPAYLPYGSIGATRAELRCGLIPRVHLDAIRERFRASLPDEAAAFILWNEDRRTFCVEFPTVIEASPSRLVYQTPVPPPGWHVVCDVHSHGRLRSYFSPTDDADDAHATKVAIVIGRLDDPAGPDMTARLCAAGMFITLPRSPFAETDHGD